MKATPLLAKSKLPSLKIRRIRTIAIETFKIINKETPQYLHDLVIYHINKILVRRANVCHGSLWVACVVT